MDIATTENSAKCCGRCGHTFNPTCTDHHPNISCKQCRLTTIVPPEVWTTIFLQLDVVDLLRVRASCRTWKLVVDGSRTLRGRFIVRPLVGRRQDMDESYNPVLLPAASVDIGCCKIVSVDAWWPGFAGTLVEIEINTCSVSLATLVGMLREAVSLKELALIQVTYLDGVGGSGVDFRMEQLERLTLYTDSKEGARRNVPVNFLDLLSQVFPRLKNLTVRGEWDKKAVLRMIETLESTLEGITFDATNKLLRALSMLKQLRLKYVGINSLTIYNRVVFGFFFQAQRFVTELSFSPAALQFLNEVEVQQLKLIRLSANLRSKSNLRTVHLPTVKHFEVAADSSDTKVNLSDCKLTNIETLRLSRIQPTNNSLTTFLLACPRLRTLQLHTLTIDNNTSLAYVFDQNFDSLRNLHLNLIQMPRRVLLQLFPLCPNLERLELKNVWCVNDGIVLKLCQSLRKLKHFTIECNGIREGSVDHIINHHSECLRQLDYSEYWDMSRGDKKRLLDHFTPWCRVNFR